MKPMLQMQKFGAEHTPFGHPPGQLGMQLEPLHRKFNNSKFLDIINNKKHLLMLGYMKLEPSGADWLTNIFGF